MHSDAHGRRTPRMPPTRARSAPRLNHSHPLSQINGLENGTQYYVRVAAYNGPGGENSSTNSTEGFATYGLSEDASQFPIMTIEQVCVVLSHDSCTCTAAVAPSMVLGKVVQYAARNFCSRRVLHIESATPCSFTLVAPTLDRILWPVLFQCIVSSSPYPVSSEPDNVLGGCFGVVLDCTSSFRHPGFCDQFRFRPGSHTGKLSQPYVCGVV